MEYKMNAAGWPLLVLTTSELSAGTAVAYTTQKDLKRKQTLDIVGNPLVIACKTLVPVN